MEKEQKKGIVSYLFLGNALSHIATGDAWHVIDLLNSYSPPANRWVDLRRHRDGLIIRRSQEALNAEMTGSRLVLDMSQSVTMEKARLWQKEYDAYQHQRLCPGQEPV